MRRSSTQTWTLSWANKGALLTHTLSGEDDSLALTATTLSRDGIQQVQGKYNMRANTAALIAAIRILTPSLHLVVDACNALDSISGSRFEVECFGHELAQRFLANEHARSLLGKHEGEAKRAITYGDVETPGDAEAAAAAATAN
ncbi:hypothetical protein FI667_g10348, partial [Globisporangium splendens]